MLHFYPSFWGFLCFYRKIIAKSDRLNVFIITFATLIKIERRNRNNDAMLSTYSHIDVYHDWDTGDNGDDP